MPWRFPQDVLRPDLRLGELIAHQQQGAGLELRIDVVRQRVGGADVFAIRVARVAEPCVHVTQLQPDLAVFRVLLEHGAVFDDGFRILLLDDELIAAFDALLRTPGARSEHGHTQDGHAQTNTNSVHTSRPARSLPSAVDRAACATGRL